MMARKLITAFFVLLCALQTGAQDYSRMLEYDFGGALSEYRDSLETCTDSLRTAAFAHAVKLAENGIALTGYCHRPKVVTRRRFHKDDFFLFYPLPDGAWHETQDSSKTIFDISGAQDTLSLTKRDSLELFPVVIGEERYFAAKDFYGMGGYDLYVSRWDDTTGDWGSPRNLGFPYSSPYDDFLFINTDDGKFSIFASNRDCPPDSVNVYVVEYEPNPVRSAVSDPVELKRIAALDPPVMSQAEESIVRENETEDENTREYREKITSVRHIRDSLSKVTKELGKLRERYPSAEGDEKVKIAAALAEGEISITVLNASLGKVSRELRDIEMNFLENGVVIDAGSLVSEAETEPRQAPLQFNFAEHRYGDPLYVKYL